MLHVVVVAPCYSDHRRESRKKQKEADRRSSGMIKSRNGQDIQRRLKDWHRIRIVGESLQRDLQQWSPIASYDGGSQVGTKCRYLWRFIHIGQFEMVNFAESVVEKKSSQMAWKADKQSAASSGKSSCTLSVWLMTWWGYRGMVKEWLDSYYIVPCMRVFILIVDNSYNVRMNLSWI